MTLILIAGPTASGKSTLALDLAQKLNGQIINADSMQVYKGLPLLSAQPSLEDQGKAPHKLYGFLEMDEPFSVAKWVDFAVQEIKSFKGLSLVVGGTGLYFKALLEGISSIPEIPSSIRDSLIQEETKDLYARLQKEDPQMAERLKPADTQRIIRALEVKLYTGKSLREWQSQEIEKPIKNVTPFIIKILPPREDLYESINKRAEEMIRGGVLDEVKAIKDQDLNSLKTLGYRELKGFLEGEISLKEASLKMQQKTRNYAKRQTTWFRHQMAAHLEVEKIYRSDKALMNKILNLIKD
jgi:tRNA dimethylallyltransferase